MIVINTKAPLKRVFVKGGEHTPAEVDGQFQEFELGLDLAEAARDPRQDERVQAMLEERLSEARAEWEKELEKKVQEAFEKGRKEGELTGQEAVAERAGQLASVIASLKEARQILLDQAEMAVLDLSLAVVRKFLDSAAVLGNDLIKQTIKSAVKMVTEKDKVVIRVNPDDIDEVRAHQDDIIFIGDGIGNLDIRGDKKVDRGGCVVETEAGNIDARVESRLDELEKALQQAFRDARAEVEGGADRPQE